MRNVELERHRLYQSQSFVIEANSSSNNSPITVDRVILARVLGNPMETERDTNNGSALGPERIGSARTLRRARGYVQLAVVDSTAFGIAQRLVCFENSPEFNRGSTRPCVRVIASCPRSKGASDRIDVCVLCDAEHSVVVHRAHQRETSSHSPQLAQNGGLDATLRDRNECFSRCGMAAVVPSLRYEKGQPFNRRGGPL
jgi:hypothetical protein